MTIKTENMHFSVNYRLPKRCQFFLFWKRKQLGLPASMEVGTGLKPESPG